MKAKVLQTTDGKFLWRIFEVNSLDMWEIKEATGNKFDFEEINVKWNRITLKNSNYKAILKILS